MVLAQPQVLAVWAVVAVAAYFVVRKYGGKLRTLAARTQSGHRLAAAHGERFSTLPGYQALAARYRMLLRVAYGGAALLVLCSVLLSLRPSSQDIVSPAEKNRDIMLCLDISGSMRKVDQKVFEKFYQLADTFGGQRVGLTVFDSSASTTVPLSNDYNALKTELQLGKVGFSVDNLISADPDSDAYKALTHFLAGTHAIDGASLVGTSLATCVDRLGANETKRAQSIILATDNEVAGTEIITTPQAMALAKQKGIRVYALDPGKDSAYVTGEGEHAQLKSTAVSTGGGYYALSDPSAVSSVIDSISKQEATLFAGKSQIARTDKPAVFVVAAVLGLAALAVVAWRVRI